MAKILAIDDKQNNLIVISALLKNLIPECTVITALSGAEGIKKATSEDPDVVLLDIIMPEMDGYDVCRQLKKDEKTRHIPVIMLTAIDTDTSSRVRGLECGADQFMAKPIDETELIAQIKVALRIKKAEDQLRKENDLLEYMVEERTKALYQSERRFRSLVENSLVGIVILQDEKIVYRNPEHKRITGPSYHSTDIMDMTFVHPDDLANVKTSYQRILKGEKLKTDLTFRFYTPNSQGERHCMKWVQCRANPVVYQDRPAILFCIMDITRTKELEYLLNIEDKMRSLGLVAAGISHEIRNPLSSINIHLSILKKFYCKNDMLTDDIVETINDSLDNIQYASKKIESVVKRVLDFSRPNEPELTLMNMNQCIESTIRFFHATLEKSDILLKTELQKNLPDCLMDNHGISQVMLNLITNAAEAMKVVEGNKLLTIRTFLDNSHIVVTVSDQGPGIKKEIREKIFDPFFTTKSNGSGIGLSMSSRIIKDHGGELSVTDSESGGAEFIIRLPVERP